MSEYKTIDTLLGYISKWHDDVRILGNLKGKDIASEIQALREDNEKLRDGLGNIVSNTAIYGELAGGYAADVLKGIEHE